MNESIEQVRDALGDKVTKSPYREAQDNLCKQACRENANSMLINKAKRLQELSFKAEKDAAMFSALAKALPQLEGLAEEGMYKLISAYNFREQY